MQAAWTTFWPIGRADRYHRRQPQVGTAIPMTRTLDSDPRRDGYRMPGEFEPHAGCWMLWPERPDNWRLGGKPAQQAFVAVATAIAASEPVSVGVSAGQYANARRLLPAAVRVVEISSNDAWMRDVGTHVRRQRPRRAARHRLDVQRMGRTRRRALFPVGPGRRRGAEGARDRALRSLSGAVRARGRRDPRRRAGHVDHHRRVPAQPQSQPGPVTRADRAPAAALPARRPDRLARQGRLPRRDRWPRRQPLRVRAARRSGPHLDGRSQRSPVRDLARRIRAADAGPGRARPAIQGAQAASARPARR